MAGDRRGLDGERHHRLSHDSILKAAHLRRQPALLLLVEFRQDFLLAKAGGADFEEF